MLVLPSSHPSFVADVPREGALRIGIVNIMPQLEAYEPSLLAPLAAAGHVVEPVFVRLESHGYASSDRATLDRFYRTFDDVVNDAPLDGLILTGAPVEELPFQEVRYWTELQGILRHARTNIRSTLGICWGGMALGGVLGIEKMLYPRKLFGVYRNEGLVPDHPLIPGAFECAHSRHSGIADAELERAAGAGTVRLLGHAPETGYTLFETPDHRFVAHLGHPEYEGTRLAFEWQRDQGLGRTDVGPPHAFDVHRPVTRWRGHREGLFRRWLAFLERDPAKRMAGDPVSEARGVRSLRPSPLPHREPAC